LDAPIDDFDEKNLPHSKTSRQVNQLHPLSQQGNRALSGFPKISAAGQRSTRRTGY
jgi:hypothetical protein